MKTETMILIGGLSWFYLLIGGLSHMTELTNQDPVIREWEGQQNVIYRDGFVADFLKAAGPKDVSCKIFYGLVNFKKI